MKHARHDLYEKDGLERLLASAAHDPEASEELDFLADVVAAAETERERLTHRPRPTDEPRFLVRPWILAAAASVLFLFALGLWLFHRADGGHAGRLRVAREAPHYVAVELRAPEEPLDGAFPRAMEPYSRGDWAAAALALESYLGREPEHVPAHFYLAATREQLGELEPAERHYERAAAAPDPFLSAHARLRLALLWHGRGEGARARVELERLRDEGGELASHARELLESLPKR